MSENKIDENEPVATVDSLTTARLSIIGHPEIGTKLYANVSAAGGAEPVAWMVKDKVTGKLWSCVEEPQIPTSQIERYEYFPLVYAHPSVAGMPDYPQRLDHDGIPDKNGAYILTDEYDKLRAYVRAIGGA